MVDQLVELLEEIGYYGLLGLVILGGLVLLSFLKPFLTPFYDEISEKLKTGKDYLFKKATEIYKKFTESLLGNYKRELEKQDQTLFRYLLHEKKLVARLVRVSNKYDKGIKKRLQEVENNVCTLLKKIGKINFPDSQDIEKKFDSSELEELEEQALQQRKSAIYFWIFLVIITAVISINTFLMNEFWFSLAPGFRKLIPILNITYAMLLAFIFALFEVGSGVAHYTVEDRPEQEEKPFYGKIRMIIVYVILVLAGIELVAFAKVAANLRFAEQLGLSPNNPLYNLADWFLAPFGPAITGMLFVLGYKVIESFFDWREYHQRLQPIRQLKKLRKQLNDQILRAKDVAVSFDHISQELTILNTQLSVDNGNPDGRNYGQTIKGRVDEAIEGIRVYFTQKKDQLSKDISVSDLSAINNIVVGTFFFIIWLLLLHMASVSLTRTFDSINFPLNSMVFYNLNGRVSIISFMIALFIGIAGFLIKKLITGEDYTTENEEKTRHFTQYLYVGLIVLALLSGLALIILSLYTDETSTSFSWLVSLFIVVALYLIGINLDHYLSIFSIVLRYTLIAFVAFLCFLLAIFTTLVWVILGVIYYIFDLLTKPGEAIRNAFSSRKKKGKESTTAVP